LSMGAVTEHVSDTSPYPKLGPLSRIQNVSDIECRTRLRPLRTPDAHTCTSPPVTLAVDALLVEYVMRPLKLRFDNGTLTIAADSGDSSREPLAGWGMPTLVTPPTGRSISPCCV